MSKLSSQELDKVRKAAIQSVTLSSEMKTSVVDAKLKEFTTEVKKELAKKNVVLEMLVVQR